VKRWEVGRAVIAVLIAAVFVKSGIARLPNTRPTMIRHAPVLVYADPMLPPLVVRTERILPSLPRLRSIFVRAPAGKALPVSLTQYCLQGTTRRDHYVREGIVAADPRIFPLAHYVEVTIGKRYLGRFLVDDTGDKVKGRTLDIWTPSCSDARRFGRQHGTAMLVIKPEK
jgi:3D (Asp-Asp-Asp) domain-containing protein